MSRFTDNLELAKEASVMNALRGVKNFAKNVGGRDREKLSYLTRSERKHISAKRHGSIATYYPGKPIADKSNASMNKAMAESQAYMDKAKKLEGEVTSARRAVKNVAKGTGALALTAGTGYVVGARNKNKREEEEFYTRYPEYRPR